MITDLSEIQGLESPKEQSPISNKLLAFSEISKMQNIQMDVKKEFYHRVTLTDEEYEIDRIPILEISSIIKDTIPLQNIFVTTVYSEQFYQFKSNYVASRPCVVAWSDLHNISNLEYFHVIQTYYKESYSHFQSHLNFSILLTPTKEKYDYISLLHSRAPQGRSVFHYVGYGFPDITETNIYYSDSKSQKFQPYSLNLIFHSLSPSALFIFDCNNGAAAISNFLSENSSPSNWLCITSTDLNEKLLLEPYLPKDFLTSCLFTPIKIAFVCHALIYYRSKYIHGNFPISLPDEPIWNNQSLQDEFLNLLDSITDAIAVESLPKDLYLKLFKDDETIAKIYRRFLLCQFLLKPFRCHPQSYPKLPDLSNHSYWRFWTNAIDQAFSGFSKPYTIFDQNYRTVSNFIEKGNIQQIKVSEIALLFRHFLFTSNEDPLVLLSTYSKINSNPLENNHHSYIQLAKKPDLKILPSKGVKGPDFQAYIKPHPFLLKSEMSIKTQIFPKGFLFKFEDLKSPLGKTEDKPNIPNINFLEVLSRVGIFTEIFELLLSHPKSDQAVARLVLSLLYANPSFINKIPKDYNTSNFPKTIFDKTFALETRKFNAAIIARTVMWNENIQSTCSSPEFIKLISDSLNTTTVQLGIWFLEILRTAFHFYEPDQSIVVNNGLHFKVALFLFNRDPIVRAEGIATLICFLHTYESDINNQCLLLASACLLDNSYLVRYYFAIFLQKYLLSFEYQSNSIAGATPLPINTSTLSSFWSSLFNIDEPLSSFLQPNTFFAIIDKITSRPDFIFLSYRIALTALEILIHDPHPSVSNLASRFGDFLSSHNNAIQSSPKSLDDAEIIYENFENDIIDGPPINTEALQTILLRGLIEPLKGNINVYNGTKYDVRNKANIDLNHEHISFQTFLTQTSSSNQITHIAFHSESLCIAATTADSILWIPENGPIISTPFPPNNINDSLQIVSSLFVVDWRSNPIVLVTFNTGVFLAWDIRKKHPMVIFRASLEPCKCSLALYNHHEKAILTYSKSSICKWDIKDEQLLGEWNLHSQSNISCLEVVSFSNDTVIASLDNGEIKIIKLDKEPIIKNTFSLGQGNAVWKMCWNNENKGMFIGTVNDGQSFSVIKEELKKFDLKNENVVDCAVHSGFLLILFCTPVGEFKIFDCAGNFICKGKDLSKIQSCAFHPSAPIFAYSTDEGKIVIDQLIQL